MSGAITVIDLHSFGAADQLFVNKAEQPPLAPGHALIKVQASGINRPDCLQRQGLYHPPPDAQPGLGLEIAGDIVAISDPATNPWNLQPGQRICALTNGGGYASYASVPLAQCFPLPDHISYAQGAALPEIWCTIWLNLVWLGNIKPGEFVLVTGASGGVGVAALQLCQIKNAFAIAVVGNAEKADKARALGAHHVLNRHEESWWRALPACTNGHGVDIVLDCYGGAMIHNYLPLMADSGRLVSIAFLGGAKTEINIAKIMAKNLSWRGAFLRPQSGDKKARLISQIYEALYPYWQKGALLPPLHRIYPYEEVVTAHQEMEANHHFGKIILDWTRCHS